MYFAILLCMLKMGGIFQTDLNKIFQKKFFPHSFIAVEKIQRSSQNPVHFETNTLS